LALDRVGRREYKEFRNKEVMKTTQSISAPGQVGRAGFRAIFVVLLAAAVFCGCARYDVLMTNGRGMTNVRKPVRSEDGTYYTVKLPSGKVETIPAGRVVAIVPHGDTSGTLRRQ
jgi:hypothetical protein